MSLASTATGMAMGINNMNRSTHWYGLCAVGVMVAFSHAVNAEEVEFSPSVSGILTYSDNIYLTDENEIGGFIGTLSAGANLNVQGSKSRLMFNYDVYQVLNEKRTEDNRLYNELSLTGYRNLAGESLTLDTNAYIKNISRNIQDNANEDVISGNTIESRYFATGLSYQSNPRGYFDIYSRLDGNITSNEDNIGDFYQVAGNLVVTEGTASRNFFWLNESNYTRNESTTNDGGNFNYNIKQEFGIKPIYNISPFIRIFYEEYSDLDGNQNDNIGTWGPAVRYYLSQRSYVEVSYDFLFDGGHFWRGAFSLYPTPRTNIEFDYSRRVFGDSYFFLFSHRTKRLTNIISYTESLTSFDRELFFEGENIEEIRLTKELLFGSTLALKRTTFGVDVSFVEQRPVLTNVVENNSNDVLRTTFRFTHELSNRTTLSGSFQFNNYKRRAAVDPINDDYSRVFDLSLRNQLSRRIYWSVSARHADNTDYAESRASLEVGFVY